jgi:hypothetical protein
MTYLPKYRHVFAIATLLMFGGLKLQSNKMNRQLDFNAPMNHPAAIDRLEYVKARRNQQYVRACMFVKDDNEQLAQWVAYHYTVLPLRRLIVGVDINSTQDPMDVLGRWTGSDLHFQVWYPDDYEHNNINYGGDSHHRYVQRQHRLYARCLQHFHQQGDLGWATLADTDEFVKLNPLDDFLVSKFHNETSYVLDKDNIEAALPHMAPNETLWDRIEFRKRLRLRLGLDQLTNGNPTSEVSPKQQLHSVPTVLEVLEEYSSEHGTLPCHSMSRRRYSAVVENFTALADTICRPKLDLTIMDSLNISKISTLQFLYHVPPLTYKYNEWAKVMVDLRRIPYDQLSRAENRRNPHQPFDECPRPYMPDIVSLIHVNHYTMHWSDHVTRRGANVRESLEKEKEMWSSFAHARDHVRCDHIHGWLNDFVDEFGLEKARMLLGN